MNRDHRSSSNDPSAERTATSSTQSASGLSTGRSGRGVKPSPPEEDVVNRRYGHTTPRRYEQPLSDDADIVMPGEDSTLDTNR